MKNVNCTNGIRLILLIATVFMWLGGVYTWILPVSCLFVFIADLEESSNVYMYPTAHASARIFLLVLLFMVIFGPLTWAYVILPALCSMRIIINDETW